MVSPDITFPFFQTTRRDHTEDQLHNMMPKKGMGYLIPVVGGVPTECLDRAETHMGKTYVNVAQADVLKMWYKDDLPPAQHLKLFDTIHASTSEE